MLANLYELFFLYVLKVSFYFESVVLSEYFSFLEPVVKVLKYKLISVDDKPITIGKIIVSLTFLIIGVYVSRVVIKIIRDKVLDKFIDNHAATHAIENISFYVMVIFFSLIALQVSNIPITVFVGIGGAVAIAAGLGAQNIANNFISGIILLIERPIKIGDFIIVDNIYGRVEDIGMRSTKVNSILNKHLIIPNSKLVENNVDNWTHNSRRIKTEVRVGVQYGSDTAIVEKLMMDAVKENPQTLKSKEPTVYFDNFGSDSLEFGVVFDIKVNALTDERRIKSEVRFVIDKKFRDSGLVISFPQRDVHLFFPEETKRVLKAR